MSEERVIVVATDDAYGFDGELSAHFFGRCPYYVLVEASDDTVIRIKGGRQSIPRFCGEHGRPGGS